VPVALATAHSRSATRRTWAIDPATPDAESSLIAEIESTTHSVGWCSRTSSSAAPTLVVAATSSPCGTSPSRRARWATCAGDSSTAIKSTASPASASARSDISARVDLPTPGSPKSSVVEPAMNPPPSTRSSSPTPVEHTVAVDSPRSRSEVVAGAHAARVLALVRSSSSVFHSPQPGQRPAQRGVVAPQSRQTWMEWLFTTVTLEKCCDV
jgi:hypothetical protein